MKKRKGFTILEMILVLTVVSLIVLVTVPNITQKKRIINDVGCQALIEVVNAQILLYDLENGEPPGSVEELIDEGYLNENQGTCPNGAHISIVDGYAEAD